MAAASAIFAACSGGGGSVPSAGSGSGTGSNASTPTTHFKPATAADKAQNRPSLSTKPTRIDSPVGGTGSGPSGPGYYTLVTSLSVDDNLNYTETNKYCDPNVFDAPWYWAQSNLAITQPEYPVLFVCTPGNYSVFAQTGTVRPDGPAAPSPTATPTSGSAAGTYIVAIDIGWFSLSITPLSGAATESNGEWTFSALVNPVNFTDGHLYAFFVANWTPLTSKR